MLPTRFYTSILTRTSYVQLQMLNYHIHCVCLYSAYRFPKDLKLQKFWAKKCEINGKWNPQSSYICSKHFSPNDFVKDMKAKLSGNCCIFC